MPSFAKKQQLHTPEYKRFYLSICYFLLISGMPVYRKLFGRLVGDKPFTFEAAVQSHVGIRDMTSAEALGLAGKMVLDCDSNADKPWLRMSTDDSTTFGGEGPLPAIQVSRLLSSMV